MATYDQATVGYDRSTATYNGVLASTAAVGNGTQPTSTGVLAARVTHRITLTSTQPTPQAVVTARLGHLLGGTGDQPAAAGVLAARVTHRVALAGSQPTSTAVLGSHTLMRYRVTLTGFQPQAFSVTYDEPGLCYESPDVVYEEGRSGSLSWRVFYRRSLAGVQPPAWGELDDRWAPGTWPEYWLSITDRPETTQYVFQLDADDYETTYDVDEASLHDDVVYHVRGIRVYTLPRRG